MQKQPPTKWDFRAASVLGCSSARIKYLNTSLTECVKQFNIKQFHREGFCGSFLRIEGCSLKALSRLQNVTEEKGSKDDMYTTEKDHAKSVIGDNTECTIK